MNEKPLWTETHISNALGHGQSVLKPKAVALCLRIVSEYEATIDSLRQQLAEKEAWRTLDTYSEIYAVTEDGRKYTVVHREGRTTMLKIVKYIDYEANYAYSPPEEEAVINTEEIVSAIQIQRENTRRPFDDISRIRFKDGSWIDVIGKPSDFIEIRSGV